MGNPKEMETSGECTTKKVLHGLSKGGAPDSTAKSSSIRHRVNSLGLSGDIAISDSVENLMEANPKHVNRLSGLFKELTKKNIVVTVTLVDLVAKNIANINLFVNLVNFMYNNKIDFADVDTELLFAATKHGESLINGLEDFLKQGMLSLGTFKLMLAYPEHASSLSQLIIHLEEYSVPCDLIEKKLNLFSRESAGRAFDFLNYAFENSIFYPGLIDIILKNEKYADDILEGAKKLRAEGMPSSFYFEVVGKNPVNAINFAKNLVILNSSSLIDHESKRALEEISEFGKGEFMFFKLLKRSDRLDPQIYAVICRNHSIFARDDVQEALNNVPLFSSFNKDELTDLFGILSKDKPTEPEVNRFINILEAHHLMQSMLRRSL